jgi:succinate dehydrogenase (ubiquinone) cytochrome b560 subunit
MALSMGAAGLGCAEIVGGSGTALSLMQTVGSSGMILTAVAKFSVSVPIVYHYAGALRHLGWDSKPDYLTLDFVEKSSYYLFGGSLAVCGGLAIFV